MRDGWSVIVAGIEPVFCCGKAFEDNLPPQGNSGALISFSSLQSSLDIHAPLAASGGASITLSRRTWGVGENAQPEALFGGLFPPSNAPRLSETLTSTDTSCTLIGNVSDFQTVNTYFHIGTECLKITAVSNITSTSVDLTVDRGQRNTQSLPHFANPDLDQYPIASLYPYAWVGRPVRIIYRGGNQEILWRIGYLTDSPRFEDDTIVLSWAPLEGRLTDTLGGFSPATANLSPLHVFTRPFKILNLFAAPDESTVEGTLTSNGFVPSLNDSFVETGAQHVTKNNGYSHNECWKLFSGPTELDVVGLSGYTSSPWGVVYSPAYVFTSTKTAHFGAFFRISANSFSPCESKGLLPLFQQINTDFASRPLVPANKDEIDPIVIIASDGNVVFYNAKITGNFNYYLGFCWSESIPEGENATGAATPLWSAFDEPLGGQLVSSSAQGGSVESYLPSVDTWARSAANGDWDGVLRYPIRPPRVVKDACVVGQFSSLSLQQHVTWVYRNRLTGDNAPLLADRWWELGEDVITFNQTLGMGSFTAKATWFEPQTDKTFEADLALDFIENADGVYKYSCKFLHPPYYAGIGDWGGRRAVFERSQATPISDESQGMLNLFESVDGTGGSYGTIAAGLAIAEENIDIPSFSSYDMHLHGLQGWSFDVTEQGVGDAIMPALLLSGTGVAGKIVNGSYKLARIPICPPMVQESVLSLDDDDFIGLPKSSLEGGIVTSYEIKLDDETDYVFTDVDAVQIYGQGSSLSIDLGGAHWEQYTSKTNALISALSRCVDTHGKPFRRWSFTIPLSKGVLLTVGDVVTVSSKYLYGYEIGRGVSDALARIVEIEYDVMNNVCSISCLAARDAVFSAGYHPFALISSTSSATTFTIPGHEATPPYGSITDIQYLREGAAVTVSKGDGSQVSLTISSKTATTITLSSSINTGGAPWVLEQTTLYSASPETDNLFLLGRNRPI